MRHASAPATDAATVGHAGPDAARDLERLRALLLAAEAAEVERLRDRVDALEAQLGEGEARRRLVAGGLVGALEDARRDTPRALSSSLAPLVVSAIQREIRNSRDGIVEALHPIMGRLVTASVTGAIATLSAEINERLERTLPVGMMVLRARARLTGRTVAEVALARLPRGEPTRLMVVERDTGALLATWESVTAARIDNPDLVAGMLSAITQFACQFGGTKGEELRTLSFEGRTLHVEPSARTLVVMETNGPLDGAGREALERGALDIVEALSAGESPDLDMVVDAVRHTGEPEDERGAEGGGRRGIRVAAALGLAALVVIGAAFAGGDAGEEALAEARAYVRADPELRLLPIRVERSGDRLALGGIVPARIDPEAVRAAIAARVDLPVDATALHAQLAPTATDGLADRLERIARAANDMTRRLEALEMGSREARNAGRAADAALAARLRREIEGLRDALAPSPARPLPPTEPVAGNAR